MRKAIFMVDADERVEAICKSINAEKDRYLERLKFLEKSAKREAKRTSERNESRWKELESRLKELGKLPDDYDGEKDALCFDLEQNMVWAGAGQSGYSFLDLFQSWMPNE